MLSLDLGGTSRPFYCHACLALEPKLQWSISATWTATGCPSRELPGTRRITCTSLSVCLCSQSSSAGSGRAAPASLERRLQSLWFPDDPCWDCMPPSGSIGVHEWGGSQRHEAAPVRGPEC